MEHIFLKIWNFIAPLMITLGAIAVPLMIFIAFFDEFKSIWKKIKG